MAVGDVDGRADHLAAGVLHQLGGLGVGLDDDVGTDDGGAFLGEAQCAGAADAAGGAGDHGDLALESCHGQILSK